MKFAVLYLVCLTTALSGAQAGELFRWADKSGKMHYSDTPPADAAADVEHLKLSSEPSQNDDLPYETRQAQQNFPVTLYVGDGCGATCDQARSLLNKRGIPFSEKLLRTRKDVEAFKQLSGFDAVAPVLVVGKNFLRGFLESQWNSELDIAGYPKTASYRQLNMPPAPAVAPASPVPSESTTPPESQPVEDQPVREGQPPDEPATQ